MINIIYFIMAMDFIVLLYIAVDLTLELIRRKKMIYVRPDGYSGPMF